MAHRFVFLGLLLSSLVPVTALGQNPQVSSLDLEFDKQHWLLEKVGAAEIRNYLDRESVFLERAQITLKEVDFSEGVIEFDLATEQPSGFVGVNFRADEKGNSEQFYVRFHQSGRPDSTQYLAKMNGLASWQLHAGPNDAAAVELGTGQWIPIRIVIEKDKADVFVRDMNTPLLHIPELRSDNTSGKVTFYAFDAVRVRRLRLLQPFFVNGRFLHQSVNPCLRDSFSFLPLILRPWHGELSRLSATEF
jgi:hypothetical protein